MGPLGQSFDNHPQKGIAGSLLGHFEEDVLEGFKFRLVFRINRHGFRINEKSLYRNEK